MLIIGADHKLVTSHVLYGHDLTHRSVTPESERSQSTNSSISGFTPQWVSTTQGDTTLPLYHRRPVAVKGKPSVEEPKRTSSPLSAARKFFTRLWAKRVTQSDTEASVANRNRDSESARSEAILSPSRGAYFTDISLR